MSTPRIDIRPDHWKIVRDILQKHVPQYEVWAFGSRAKWTAKDYSDLDLCVISDKPLSLSVSAALADDFSESDLPWKVDVVDWASTAESFRMIIERDKVVVQKGAQAREWKKFTLDQIKATSPNAIAMGPFGSRIKTDNFVPAGVPVIRGGNLNAPRLLDDGFVFLTEEKADELRASNARPGDIVITHRGTIGQVGIIPYDAHYPRYVVSQSQMKFTVDAKKADPYFIYYFLRSTIGQHQLLANTSQVGVPAIAQPTSSLKAIEVLLPPTVDEQRAIAGILGTLDDKIELNRRMNETLEAIARAMFKSWFVDFDPVRAKMSGEPPESICQRLGLTPDLLALFPDRLVESELGEIPEGWREKRVDDVLELAYGKALKATERIEGEVPVYGSGGVTGYHSESLVDGPGIIIGRKGTVGSLYWEDRPFFPIDTVFYVIPKVQLTFCYYLLQTLGLERMNTDAAVPGLNRNNVYRLTFTWPRDELRREFDKVVKSLRETIFSNFHKSKILVDLRDSLLPKLLTGELNVPVTGDV